MTTEAPQEKQRSSSSKGTFLCTAFVYVFLVAFVCAFFFLENEAPSSSDDSSSSSANGLQRVFNMAQSHFGKSIYQQETQKQEPDQETAIAKAKEQQKQNSHSILSNDEDSNWPHWLGKYAFMPTPDEIDAADRVCYVHVGKTAGSTMACELGFAYEGCPVNHVKFAKGNLPLFTTSMMHKSYNRCLSHDMAYHLFVVRDPFTRMQSWFTYERPVPGQKIWNKRHYASKLELFVDCPFDTLDKLGGAEGLGANNATHCSRDAWRAITGERGYAVHNYYNYQRYLDNVLEQNPSPRILVLRTEHLEQDWRRIEMDVLQGPEPFDEDFKFPHKHPSAKEERDQFISDESTRNICRALCHEIQVYKRILIEAENLDEDDFVESMRLLSERCPVEAANGRCE